jgi:hypothetical protein
VFCCLSLFQYFLYGTWGEIDSPDAFLIAFFSCSIMLCIFYLGMANTLLWRRLADTLRLSSWRRLVVTWCGPICGIVILAWFIFWLVGWTTLNLEIQQWHPIISSEIGGYCLINILFDTCSYFVTRWLIEKMRWSASWRRILSFWVFDLSACVVIGILTFWTIYVFVELNITNQAQRIGTTVGAVEGMPRAFPYALTALFPTLCHCIFAAVAFGVFCWMHIRRMLYYVVYRAFEHGKPFSILAGGLIVLAGLAGGFGRLMPDPPKLEVGHVSVEEIQPQLTVGPRKSA